MPVLELHADRSARRRIVLGIIAGTLAGLLFGIPPILDARALGLTSPMLTAVIVAVGLVVGVLTALLLLSFMGGSVFRSVKLRSDAPSPRPSRSASAPANTPANRALIVRQRLAEEKARLDSLEALRRRRDDANSAKTAADRIIWWELLELELQSLDEHIQHVCETERRSS